MPGYFEHLNIEYTTKTPIEKRNQCLLLSGYCFGMAYLEEKSFTEHDRKMLLEMSRLLREYAVKIEQEMHKKIEGKPHFFSD